VAENGVVDIQVRGQNMGLSAGAVYFNHPGRGREVAMDLAMIGPTEKPTNHNGRGFDVADGIRLVDHGQWSVILLSPEVFYRVAETLSPSLSGLSRGGRVVSWYTQSASAGVVFEVHEAGDVRRRWVEAEGEILEDVGTPLQEEEGLIDPEDFEGGPHHDEWSVLALVERLTNISVDTHFEMTGVVYAAAP
jgi:hypothetical protein